MNNYYTLLHLADSLKGNLQGAEFISAITVRKHLLEIRFLVGNEPRQLMFSTDPAATAVFLSTYRDAPSSNVKSFFSGMNGQRLARIELADRDRLLSLFMNSGEVLLLQCYTSKANAFHVREGVIAESFKRNQLWAGKPAPEPVPAAKPTSLMPRKVGMEALGQILNRPQPSWIDGYGFSLAGEEFLPGVRLKTYSDINEGVRDVFFAHVHDRTFEHRKRSLTDRLTKLHGGLAHMMDQLSAHPAGLDRAATYERYGHLLMSRAHERLPSDQETLAVEDWMKDGESVDIPLKKGAGIPASAEWYFAKAKESRTAVEMAKSRLIETKIRFEEVDKALNVLEPIRFGSELEKWVKANSSVLNRTGFDSGGEDQVKVPYRTMEISGYEIWIGKNAQSNDDMLRLAHKDDLWMHARGSAGSHVIVRMKKRTVRPPMAVLEKVAGIAAWYSKQKGSSLVPVILTQRKYVRKPKGAPAGLVLVDREEVLMVKPEQGG